MSETPLSNIKQLRQLAVKLQENHEFMAWTLAAYQTKEHIDEDRLMVQLKTTPEMFVRLALCKCPNPNSATFASQVREIATYTNIDPVSVAIIIRQVDSLDILSKLPRKNEAKNESARTFASGLLAAARDKTGEEEAENEKNDNESKGITGGNDVA